MKLKFTDLPIGSCFMSGKNGNLRKKVDDRKIAIVKDSGKVSNRKVKGDPDVEPTACPVRYLGVGLRRHPAQVVEIGDGDLLKRRGKR